MKRYTISLLTLAISTSFFTQADDIEKITITAEHINRDKQAETSVKVTDPDLSSWLNSVPGANVNRNGVLTGIAQYRGLFGDRVAINMNNHTLIGAGPNAMDTPLSYSPTFLVESMSVYQGIAPVSAGLETLGGAIEVNTLHAESDARNTWQSTGQLKSTLRSNNNARSISGLINTSKQQVALLAYADWQKASDEETGSGDIITPTRYQKHQAGGDIRYFTDDDNNIGISYHYTDTKNSGTPALPMDIKSILASNFTIDGKMQYKQWDINYQLGYLDNTHAMDNFSLRQNNNPAKYRNNYAEADTVDFTINAQKNTWLLGASGYVAHHNSTITNPNNPQFNILNFNEVKDQRLSVFAQWQGNINKLQLETGMRVKHITANSGKIDHFTAMMNPAIKQLKNQFNQSDRNITDTNIDVSINTSYPLALNNNQTTAELVVSAAIKQRAPSYQERYLWLPMEATGGLADGNTYIGNINLNAETAYQSDIGVNYQQQNLHFTVHGFYQYIADYIQANPSTNAAANMVAKMMTGKMPLQYANVEAKLYGADGQLTYQITPQLRFNTIISYVRGKRDDINDNLYRIAPLNTNISINYQVNEQLTTSISWLLVDKQTRVSNINREKPSAGYGLINADMAYELADNVSLKAGIYNLFNREYHNHLGGYNRVKVSNTPLMARLPEQGRSLWAELNYYF